VFIDIHSHTRLMEGPPRFHSDNLTYASPDELWEAYESVGIERSILLPRGNPECAYSLQSNEEVLYLAEKYPFVPFCNMDPRCMTNSVTAPFERVFKYYRDKGCKGIGEVCANLPMLDPLVQAMFKGAEAAGLPMTIHMSPYIGHKYGLVDNAGLPQLEATLQRFPALKIFGHSQAFWAEMGARPKIEERMGYPKGKIQEEGRIPQLMRKYENLYGDLSAGSGYNALARDPEYAAKFLTEFQDRLFFGTDVASPKGHMDELLFGLANFLKNLRQTGKISETVFQKVARENAIRVLEL
jgi:predicted TIM-barrel fold metal-dependent hydrolase